MSSAILLEQEYNNGEIDALSMDSLQLGSSDGAQQPKKTVNKASTPAVDASSWKTKNKGVIRDKKAERLDPDFTRNRQIPHPIAVPFGYGGNWISSPDPMVYGQHQQGYGLVYNGAAPIQYIHHSQPPQMHFAHPGPGGYVDPNYDAPVPRRRPSQYGSDPYNSGRGWVNPGPSRSPFLS